MFDRLKKSVSALMPKIYQHPFNQELIQGRLPLEKFIFYLSQDALYLVDFSKALTLTAARLSDQKHREQFIQLALDALHAERDLHRHFLKKHAALTTRQQSPFCFMYTNYLLRLASSGTLEEAVASLLPCFWIYQQVGQHASSQTVLNNPYQDWIDLYSSSTFNDSVEHMINTLNKLALRASAHDQQKMINAFTQASLCEWHFWQGAYSQQTWFI
ncbi:thiaminase II [Rickettsiella grylli]|uniref:thiaminase II n=1 Tax=Rickettsiella grylli TaxID=59196 RepID=UPI0008FD4301|nr:thiaminase II [Rickettsiella grylli]OIZ98164.1 thiaminase II [Rickettsiella grylli]